MTWNLRKAHQTDVDFLAELRAEVLRPDLERLGRYDGQRVRRRMHDTFSPEHTSIIVVDGEPAGSVTLRPGDDGWWLEHFYLSPALQGRGIGTAVLDSLLARLEGHRVRLNVLQGSAARRLYERHGFVVDSQDPVDIYMSLQPSSRTNSSKEI
ncbi:GNAT family N-acetyltransferase [Nonomuraea sp. NPDC050663]|uniref:GNAT family N-acetyltransferase n=1 Tax=Nonomuraea sp. NPDC050663 TaxID=3364370 RepID=UPI0037965616